MQCKHLPQNCIQMQTAVHVYAVVHVENTHVQILAKTNITRL